MNSRSVSKELLPAALLRQYTGLISTGSLPGPVLDLACGRGENGLFLAVCGHRVILADVSESTLELAGKRAAELKVEVQLWQVDLESSKENLLPADRFGAILVFRYLHRPLIPQIKEALRAGGVLFYETFTIRQAGFGKPRNPDHLLQPGELPGWFAGWEVIHAFEGLKADPPRAVAQLVCRKP
jgi:SAM-dependent methyltransferase